MGRNVGEVLHSNTDLPSGVVVKFNLHDLLIKFKIMCMNLRCQILYYWAFSNWLTVNSLLCRSHQDSAPRRGEPRGVQLSRRIWNVFSPQREGWKFSLLENLKWSERRSRTGGKKNRGEPNRCTAEFPTSSDEERACVAFDVIPNVRVDSHVAPGWKGKSARTSEAGESGGERPGGISCKYLSLEKKTPTLCWLWGRQMELS